MEQEQDLVVFTDDEGHDFTLEVLDYFFYNGQEYAILADYEEEDDEEVVEDSVEHDCGCEEESCEHCHGQCEHDPEDSVYIMKVVPVEDDQEEFVPVDDEELMDQLIGIAQTRLSDLFEDDDEDLDDDE